uniref:Neuroglian-like protein n=1 Tax=Tetracapsuloides bryosalmonae TaxID=271932 RepID=A0A859IR83_9CNID|nr:neuroglian-like protein [Tetracapsuloides bryosalmonae]
MLGFLLLFSYYYITITEADELSIINALPKIINISKSHYSLKNYPYYMHCNAIGSTPITYQWFKDGLFHSQSQRIDIESLKAEDTGSYHCVVSNKYGQSLSSLIDLIFYDLPKFIDNIENQLIVDATIGKHLEIKCPKHIAPQRSSYRWDYSSDIQTNSLDFLSGRMIIIQNGSLFFSHFELSDFNNIEYFGGLTCLVVYSVSVVKSQPILINIINTIALESAPTLIKSSPSPMIIIKNEPFRLFCAFDGNKVIVKWKHNGILLNCRWISCPFYYIKNSDTTHAGQYQCFAINSYGESQAVIEVVVLESLKFISSPENYKQVAISDHISLDCSSNYPNDRITWYHNATKIEKESVIWKIQNNQLMANDVKENNYNGIIQCMIQNKNMFIISWTYLQIKIVLPTINFPASKHYLFENLDSQIKCSVTGSPTPNVQWTRLNAKLNNQWTINNNLMNIRNPTKSDEGFYSCSATNIYGSASSSIEIKVIKQTTFKKKSINISLITGETGHFICIPVCDLAVKCDIIWTKDDNDIPASSNVFVEPQAESKIHNKLIINRAITDNTGNYICNTRLRDHEDNLIEIKKQSFRLIVYGPPNTPSRIDTSAISCDLNNKKFHLTWNNEPNVFNTVSYHLVEFGSSNKKDELVWEFYTNSTEDSLILDHIPSPCSIKIRVLACNKYGCSSPSNIAQLKDCSTCDETAPFINPTKFHCSSTKPGEIIIEFEDIKNYHKIGSDFQHVLFLQTEIIDSNKYSYVNFTLDSFNRRFVIENSEKPAVFYVRSKNHVGLSSQVDVDEVYTCNPGFTAPNILVNNFNIVSISQNNLKLSWNCYQSESKSKYLFYSIQVSMVPIHEQSKLPYMENFSVPIDKCTFENNNLPKGYQFNATICISSNINCGPTSNVVKFSTNGEVSTPPRFVESRPYGQTLYVSWYEPEHTNGIILEYVIHVSTLYNKESVVFSTAVKPTKLHTFITDLPPLEYVQVKVFAVNSMGISQPSVVNSSTSYNDIPSTPEPPIVNVGQNGNVCVTFQIGGYGGMPDSFRVYAEASKIDVSSVEVRFPDNNMAFLSLLPGRYQIYTVARYKNYSSRESPIYNLNLLRYEIELEEEISNIIWFKSSGFIVSAVVCSIAVFVMLIATLIFRKNQSRRRYVLAELEKRVQEETEHLTCSRV